MCFLPFFPLIFIMRNSNREASEQSPRVWVFWSFALESISCCDGGLRSFLQGDPKSFHSTFIPQSKKHWVLQDWCPVHEQQWALNISRDGCRWRFVRKQGKVLESGDKAEHEIVLQLLQQATKGCVSFPGCWLALRTWERGRTDHTA